MNCKKATNLQTVGILQAWKKFLWETKTQNGLKHLNFVDLLGCWWNLQKGTCRKNAAKCTKCKPRANENKIFKYPVTFKKLFDNFSVQRLFTWGFKLSHIPSLLHCKYEYDMDDREFCVMKVWMWKCVCRKARTMHVLCLGESWYKTLWNCWGSTKFLGALF